MGIRVKPKPGRFSTWSVCSLPSVGFVSDPEQQNSSEHPRAVMVGMRPLFLLLLLSVLVATVSAALWMLLRQERALAHVARVFPERGELTARFGSEGWSAAARGNLRAMVGRRLADLHCAGCHLTPRPSALPREAWPQVLSHMAARMGAAGEFPELADQQKGLLEGLRDASELPSHSALDRRKWFAISEYYYRRAPATLPELSRPPLSAVDARFMPHTVLVEEPGRATDVTFVQVQRGLLRAGILQTSEATDRRPLFRLLEFGADGRWAGPSRAQERPKGRGPGSFRLLFSRELTSAPVGLALSATGESALALLGGPPADHPGRLLLADRVAHNITQKKPLFEASERVAHIVPWRAPDGGFGWVVSGFGQFRGGLYFVPASGKQARLLLAGRGFVAAAVGDFDKDGTPDLAALAAQDRETLHVLFGASGGRDTRHVVVHERGPETGFLHVLALDVNGDGRTDLAVTNGDNGDFPGVGPKPYHGISIVLSTAQGFQESFRLPLHGAGRAVAADFDGDGRADLAVTAMYPATRTRFAHERAVILYNRSSSGRLSFETLLLALPAGFRPGTIDAADFDGDGDTDLVMGAVPYLSDPAGDRTPRHAGAPRVLLMENRAPLRGP